MINLFKFLPRQWKLLATAIANISQAIILFSLAAIFVPKTVSLPPEFPRLVSISFLIIGLILLMGGVIIIKRGKD